MPWIYLESDWTIFYALKWLNLVYIFSEAPAEESQPIVEEPETPEAPADEEPAGEASEDEKAEPDVTDEE